MTINPRNKGWLNEIVAYRKANIHEITEENIRVSSSLFSIYQAIQPIGLLNAQLFSKVAYPGSNPWFVSSRNKLKLRS